jgi:UDP-glucose 4-epimerase
VIANFLKQAVREGTLVIHNSGTQTRDFVYLDDVVDALIKASSTSDVDGMTINIGSGKEVSIVDLVQEVVDLTGVKTESIYNHTAKGGVKRMRADISRAADLLGYRPKYSLSKGLKLTLERDPRYQVSGLITLDKAAVLNITSDTKYPQYKKDISFISSF